MYQFSAELVEMCDRHDIPFTVENPANSLLWLTPFLKPLVQRLFYHVVDACEYGSEHKKTTGFLANFNAPRLQQRCKGDHTHKVWTISKTESGEWQFDTAKEAEYPFKLARELEASFMDTLLDNQRMASLTSSGTGVQRRRRCHPSQLRGGTPVDAEGRSICYGYNLGTCHEKVCKKGRHVCCKPGCFAPSHNFLNHIRRLDSAVG